MRGLILHTSNRLEFLADMLAERLKDPAGGPLDQEMVVVQSRGMARWVTMALAERMGICANVAFPFPDTMVGKIFQTVLPGVAQKVTFDRGPITWRIMDLLELVVSEPGFEDLAHYLDEQSSDLKRLQLADRVSFVFDQYLMFRPEMILDWEAGKQDHWQARLWRRLAPALVHQHRPALGKAFIDATERGDFTPEGLPERISVFGISSLPSFHLGIFARLSNFIPVHFFLMNPSMEYWGDIVSDWEYKVVSKRGDSRGVPAAQLHLEKGNSLLSSMGGQGRDFFDWVNEFESEEVQLFEDPGEKTLLSCIQCDVLYLRDHGGNDARHLVAAGDSSVQIHSCHSPIREMEVLYDSLLDLVERDPHLMPKDILVMAPDVEAYAPYIQAVFGTPEEESARFPFSIADRNAARESRLVNAFFQILDLCSSRMTASDVMTTVESRPVRERFGFVEADLHLVRRWIRESGIRWGIDGEFRRRCGLPPSEQNTWKMGLDRLLLGYAMSEANERMFHGILPYGAVEGGETAALERLVIFCDRLFGYVKAFEQVRAVNEWANVLTELIDDFLIVPGSDGPESRWLKERIADLKEHGHGPGENEKTVDLSAIRWYLARSLEETGLGRGFLSGGITFCAMLPMRSIPFKVICLVGMNSDAYPRKSNSVGFDLMARSPRRGDRSRRRDDRYLFLEALLSAREVLYISYVGQSMRDNSVRPPSVLVSELTDYIEKGFRFADGDIRNHVVTTHRLQPFNHAYFQAEGRHFSYSKTHAQVAEAGKNRQKASPFVSRGLRAPEKEGGQVSLTDLCRFFFNPAKFFLNRRLNMALEDEGAVLEDEEAFEVSGLERYKLEQDLVERALSGQVLEGALTATQAAGILPHGVVGECLYKRICRQAEEFVQKTRPYLCGCRSVLHLDLNVSDIQLYGELNHVYGNGPVFWRYALLQPKDRLWAWIHHLATQAVADIPKKVTTVIGLVERGKDKRRRWTGVQFDPVSNASVLLEDLLRIYKSGLVRAVPFFPETSWAYAYRFQRSGSSDAAKRVAGQVWRGSLYHRGEGDDPYCRLCFRDVPPLDSEFEDLAITVFGPLLRNCRFISHEEESR